MREIWKDIKGYEGLYQISNLGNIKSYQNGKVIIKKTAIRRGYLSIRLHRNGKGKWYTIHRLVAEHFIPNTDNLPQVNHKNEVKTDNRVDNLEWCDARYNSNYGSRNEKISNKRKNDSQSKTVFQYTLDGEFIKEYPSLGEIKRQLGYDKGNIAACCNGIYKQRYGFIWKYKTPEC